MQLWKSFGALLFCGRPEILVDELFIERGRVQQAGAWDREEGLFGAGGEAGFD